MEEIYDNIRNFILFKLRINSGSQTGINSPPKEEIVEFCESNMIETKGLTKEQLIEEINNKNISDEVLIEYFRDYLGIHSAKFQEKFNIDHKTVKKLEKKGVLPVVYKERARAYGKYLYIPQYDALIYFDSKENFQKLLEQL